MSHTNQITVDDNGLITLPDGRVIDANQPEALLPSLNGLTPALLAALLQIAGQEAKPFNPHFTTLLSGIAAQKNVVGGSISHVQTVRIGDERHYHFQAVSAPPPKELTSRLPRTRSETLVGRANDLVDVRARLFDHKQVVLVNGLGGIGKTSLAQAYVDAYYEAYGHIAWVSQFSADFRADLVNTAGLLTGLGLTNEGQTQETLFNEIIMALRGLAGQPNLLVIDNAEAGLSGLYDYLPRPPQWHILVTSRERIERFDLKELGFLSEAEAETLFWQHYTLGRLAAAEIQVLVRQVECHTLTIEILAKTAQRQRLTGERLQRALAEDAPANVSVGHAGGKIEKVRAYLESIFDLSGLSPAELWLLQQFTCLPPEFHPYDLLRSLIQPEKSRAETVFNEALADLVDKGWLLRQADESGDSFKMHRIIAEVTAHRHPPGLTEVEPLLAGLTGLLSMDYSKDNPRDKFPWIPFGQALLAHFDDEQAASIATLQNNLALRLKALGDYAGAKGLLEKALRSAETNFGPDHPSTAVRYSNLATVLKALGDYGQALSLAARAVTIFEHSLPAGHPYLATVREIYQAIQDKLKS